MKHGAAETRGVRAYLQGLEDQRQRDRHERHRDGGQEVPAEERGVDGELGAADWAAIARELQPHD